MIQIEKIKLNLPKWKWWQVLLFVVCVILALKTDPSSAYDLLINIIDRVRSP